MKHRNWSEYSARKSHFTLSPWLTCGLKDGDFISNFLSRWRASNLREDFGLQQRIKAWATEQMRPASSDFQIQSTTVTSLTVVTPTTSRYSTSRYIKPTDWTGSVVSISAVQLSWSSRCLRGKKSITRGKVVWAVWGELIRDERSRRVWTSWVTMLPICKDKEVKNVSNKVIQWK